MHSRDRAVIVFWEKDSEARFFAQSVSTGRTSWGHSSQVEVLFGRWSAQATMLG